MATTGGSSQGSPKSLQAAKATPKKNTPNAAPKASGKRAAGDDSQNPPPAKRRGRPPKKDKTPKEETPKKAKEQKTIEETMTGIGDDKNVAAQINCDVNKTTENQEPEKKEIESSEQNGLKENEQNAFDEVNADDGEAKKAAQHEQAEKTESINKNNESVVEDEKREAATPSSILEKGVIYFFFRSRVNVEHPQGVEDVARSYIVLRPLPLGAKLGDGPLEDSGNARLLALPKKMLPKSRKDRFLVFVEKPKALIKDLREHFSGNEYATKTVGTSSTPAATPFAEGIYAITTTGRESHLAYQITVPSTIGEIQEELGLHEKGSFVVSVKNPNAPGPANASLSSPAEYPESTQKKFRDLRWMPLDPELLDYQNTQFLIIGEGMGDLGHAVEELSKDAQDGEKDKPEEELAKLEAEDHARVQHLKEDDPVFADLGLSSKEYPKMQTTWT